MVWEFIQGALVGMIIGLAILAGIASGSLFAAMVLAPGGCG